MAIEKLTDIVSVFESKWTYGDSKFEYDFEINQDHDIQYPVLQIEPPTSIIPEIYNGREEYEFEINFYNLYSQGAQSVVVLQQRWDNLQDLALEWLDMVLKHYQDSSVEAYLNDESVEIERVKEVANDRLVQIKLLFTMSGFTKCFRPQSFYPSNLSNLRLWLKADSVGVFDIPTKQIAEWTDRSGNGLNVEQGTAAYRPLRIGYDGAKDKAYVEFDGTDDSFGHIDNLLTQQNLTMFFVFKQASANVLEETVFYIDGGASESIKISCKGDKVYTNITDESGDSGGLDGGTPTDWNIVELRLEDAIMSLTINGTAQDTSIGSYNPIIFVGAVTIGALSGTSEFFDGQVEEIIVFDRDIDAAIEQSKVRTYLSEKYNITVS